MEALGSEDEDFVIRRYRPPSPVHPNSLLSENLEQSGTNTPSTDHSMSFKNSLGLVVSPHSPPYRKVRSMRLETPKSSSKANLFLKLEPPAFSSTPAASRSLKARHKSRYDFKDKLNITVGNVPSSLANPFSPYRTSQDCRQPMKSPMEKKKITFETEEEDECREEFSKSKTSIKRPKLSDFDSAKFEKEFLVLGILGSGDHGCVFKCLHLLTGMEYAVKRSLRPINNEKVARNEIFAHAALEHPHIVRNYVSWSENDYVFMQNEYCNGGNLEEHFKNNGPMQEKELMVLLEHLAQGIRFIHKCNLAHMDIKPGNIFLTTGPELYYKHHQHHSTDDSKEETTYKIGDLGHVIKMDNTGYVEDGDCRYLPREMLNDSHLEYSKVDIFALGLSLFEAAGGGPLPKNGEEWHAIRDGHIKTFSHLSTQFNNLLRRMIDEDPKKRPSACELLEAICRDEVLTERELKAANQKIHLLEHQLSGGMSEIKGFYAGCNVFITGATGFLGAILLEKLIRSCSDINTVYILIRERKGINVQDRLKQLLDLPVFQNLDEKSRNKIIPLQGDLNTNNLGLSSKDILSLVENVSVVFHVAADINFSPRLNRAIEVNVLGTRRVLRLAKTMPQIKSFVYLSTAYANCNKQELIEEKVYPVKWTPEDLLSPRLVNKLNEPSIQNWILNGHPNPYTFSKLMAENLVIKERGDIPLAIVRPSIVLGTLNEPMAGWVDNVTIGQFAFIAGAFAGIFRTFYAHPNMVADMVPSDQLASLVITSAYIAHRDRSLKVYHFTSGNKNPITWGQYTNLAMQGIYKYPLLKEAIYPRAQCRSTHWRNKLQIYISHYIPAAIHDRISSLTKRKPMQLFYQRKYAKGMECSKHFTLNQFHFSTSNTDKLLHSLSLEDRTDFDFDLGKINWKNYLEDCVIGIRQYYHKEPLSNLKRARQSYFADMAIYYMFWLVLIWIFWYILSPIGSFSLPVALFIVFLYYML